MYVTHFKKVGRGNKRKLSIAQKHLIGTFYMKIGSSVTVHSIMIEGYPITVKLLHRQGWIEVHHLVKNKEGKRVQRFKNISQQVIGTTIHYIIKKFGES